MNDERPTNFRKRRSYPRSGTGLPFRLLPYCLSPGAEARNFMSIVGKAIEPYGRTASFRCVAPGAHLGGVDDGCIEMLVIIRCPWANIIDRVRTESRVTVDGCIWYLPRFPLVSPSSAFTRSNVFRASQRRERMSTLRVAVSKEVSSSL